MRTGIATHCGCKISKMAAKLGKFRKLQASFIDRIISFPSSFSKVIKTKTHYDSISVNKISNVYYFQQKHGQRKFIVFDHVI